MGKVVEDSVLRMEFDNSRFERNVKQSQKTIETFKDSLDFTNSSKSLAKLQKESQSFNMNGVEKAVEAVRVKFSALDTIGVTVLANLTTSAINAGKKIVSALALDGLSDGWNEYKLKMNSIQTIIMSTGESLNTVNKYLDELNTYSDRTIYSFSDMTENIGKFTNAGVGLKDAVAAIKGVSNEAAISGANAQQASHAMYNFAQALSSGYVKLIDWKSIEVANMATQDFKQNLLDTAVALGTVKKQGDMYVTTTTNAKGATSDAFNATKEWNDNLQYQWMTTDVLVQTLAKYTDESTELGRKAYAAASEFKDANQMFQAWKEAIGSGWERTWETVFGNFEESKKLWSFLDSIIGDYIVKTFAAKNATLDSWKKLGGRNDLINSLTNIIAALVGVLATVKEAWRSVFPEAKAKDIKSFTEKISDFTKKLVWSEDTIDKVYRTLKGFFTIIKIGTNLIGNGLNVSLDIASKLFPTVADGLLSITASAGDAISKSGNSIDKVTTKITNFIKLVGQKIALPGFEGIVSVLQTVWQIITIVGGKVTSFFKMLGSGMSNAFRSGDIKSALDILNTGLISGMLIGLNKFVAQFNSFFKDAKKTVDGITKILDPVRECFEAFQSKLRADALIKIASAIGILAVSLMLIASIKPDRLASALVGISGLFSELMLSLAAFSKISGSMKGTAKSCAAMISISAAVLILSSAMKKLSSIDWSGIGRGLTAVGGLLAELLAFQAISKQIDKVGKASKGIISISLAMLILSQAVKNFGNLSWDQIGKGLTSVAALLASIAAFTALTGNAKKVISTSTAMISLSIAMNLLALAMNSFSGMSWTGIAKGLTAMGAALAELAVAMNVMPKGMVTKGAGLIAVATALNILTVALSNSGNMAWTEIAKGLIAIGGSLGILAIALNAMKGTISGGIALTTAAGALAILTPQLLLLGNMSVSSIAKSLLTLAGAFTVIGVAGAALTPILPAILGMAGAFALIGASVLGIGTGLLAAGAGLTAIAAGFTALAGMTTAGATAIVASLSVIITGIAGLIPAIASEIGEGIVEFCNAIANGASAIGNMVKTVLLTVLDVINTCAPDIVETVVGLIDTLLTTISLHMPNIVNAGMGILEAFISGIADHIGDITESAIDVVINFINAISDKLPDVIDAGFNLIISFIDGLADAIDKNTPKLTKAVNKLIIAVLDAAVTVLTGGVDLFKTIGSKIMSSGLVKGIKSKASTMIKTIKDSISSGIKSAKSFGNKWLSVGKNFVSGIIKGIKDKAAGLAKAAADAGKEALNGIKKFLDIHSPSKKTKKEVGVNFVLGAIQGVYSKSNQAFKAGKDSGKSLLNGAKEGSKGADKIVSNATKSASKEYKKSKKSVSKEKKKIVKNTRQFVKEMSNAISSFSKDTKISKVLSDVSKLVSYTSLNMSKVSTAVFSKFTAIAVNAANVSKYAEGIIKNYSKNYAKNQKSATKATKEATSAIQAYATVIYKKSSYYKDDKKNLSDHLKQLRKYYSERTKLNANLSKALSKSGKKSSKKTSSANSTAVKNARKSLNDNLKNINKFKKQIAKDQKDMVKNAKKALNDVKKEIKSAVKEYIDIFNAAINSIDLFAENDGIGTSSALSTIKDSLSSLISISNFSFDSGINFLEKFSSTVEDTAETVTSAKEDLASAEKELAEYQAKSLAVDGRSQKYLEKIAELEEKVAEAKKKVADASKTASQEMLENMKSNVEGYEEWQKNLETLSKSGISKDLLEYLRDLGISGAEQVAAFAKMTESELAQANDYWKSYSSISTKTFTDGLKDKAEAMTKWGEDIEKFSNLNIDEKVKSKLLQEFQEQGVDSEEYIKHILSMSSTELKDFVDEYSKMIEIPEKVAANVAKSIDEVNKKTSTSTATMTDYITRMKENLQAEKDYQANLKKLKKNGVSDGLYNQLINSGDKTLIAAFANAAKSDIDEANKVYKDAAKQTADEWLQSYGSNIADEKKWNENMKKLAKLNIPKTMKESLYNEFKEKGVEGNDLLELILGLDDTQLQSFVDKYKNGGKVASTIANTIVAGAANVSSEAQNTIKNSAQKAANTAINSLSKSITKSASKTKKSGKKVGSETVKGFATYVNTSNGKKLGKNICDGMANGIKLSGNVVKDTAKNVAKNAYLTAKRTLGIKSPSRKFKELGMYCNQGMANGLSEYSTLATNAAGQMGDDVLNRMQSVVSTINMMAQSGVDAQPTIRPVYDMSELEAQASQINGLLGAGSIGVSAEMASSVSRHMGAALNNQNRVTTTNSYDQSTHASNYNTFNITSNNPKEVANEVSKILQNQVSRRETVWA